MTTPLKPGDRAPDFELLDQNGKTVKRADFASQKLLIYFYPRANTPGCTTQSCAVRDSLASLVSLGVAAVGISPDSPLRQKRFDLDFSLGFPLLADEAHAAAEAYGVWDKKTLYGKLHFGIIRSAFLIAPGGTVLAAWYKVSPGDTVPNVITFLKANP